MKVGDLVRFVQQKVGYDDYPQHRGKLGVVVRARGGNMDCFVVNIGGKNHPYFIHRNSMEVVNENR